MSCPYCEVEAKQYDLKNCLGCAVRIVRSARPSRKQQEKMLDYVGQWHDKHVVKAKVVESK